jgi:hypothetical protein
LRKGWHNMLQVILFILKLIGWILLAILGLLFLVLLAVIFTPLRYQAETRCPGKLSELEADVRFGIFFRLVSGRLQYRKGKMEWNIRAAWIRLGDNGEAEEEIQEAAGSLEEIGENVLEDIAEKEEASEEAAEVPEEAGSDQAAEISEEAGSDQAAEISEDTKEESTEKTVKETAGLETQERKESSEEDSSEIKAEKIGAGTRKKAEKKKEKSSSAENTDTGGSEKEPKKTLSDKVAAVLEKIEYTFDRMCAKIELLSAKAELVTEFLSDDVHQSAFLKCLAELKKLLFRLRPKQCRGMIRFGFEDPSLTGKVLAGASMLYPYWGEHVYCCPDFVEKVLEGEVSVKGSLRILPAAVMGWNLLWSRNVRRTVLDAKRMISKLRNS